VVQKTVSNLISKQAAGHLQQLRTIANDGIKMLTEVEHQLR